MRLLLAILVGKSISFLTKFFKKGGGSAAPGYYALKIEPRLVSMLADQAKRSIVITGTNGKTTTARMLAHILTSSGKTVIRNSTGSNLERGIASELIKSYPKKFDFAIWELDEAAFNKTAAHLNPRIIVFLNALRDQLDRYGEVDTVVKNWKQSLKQISNKRTILILNGDDPNIDQIKKSVSNKCITFGVKGKRITGEKVSKKDRFVRVNYLVEAIEEDGLDGTYFNFEGEQFYLPLPGIYHIYNAAAALLVSKTLQVSLRIAADALKTYTPAFGRFEKIGNGYIFLIKNPTGATEVLKTIVPHLKPEDRLLLALNDNFADGLDVSWIWDTEWERICHPELVSGSKIPKQVRNDIYVSGTRAEEMALRLKYAGVDLKLIMIESDIRKAFEASQEGLKGSLFVLPTYTALLELQAILAKSGAKKHYWKE